jgi:hypothetical protein
MYSRITASSRPTIEMKYPLAQKCCPVKLRFRSPIDTSQVDSTRTAHQPFLRAVSSGPTTPSSSRRAEIGKCCTYSSSRRSVDVVNIVPLGSLLVFASPLSLPFADKRLRGRVTQKLERHQQEGCPEIGLVVSPSLPDRADEVDRMTVCGVVVDVPALSKASALGRIPDLIQTRRG